MENFKKNIQKFLPYLEDLRRRLYRGAILFVITFCFGFLFSGIILKKVLSLVHIDQVIVATSAPFQYTEIAMDIGFFLAIVVCIPYLIYSFYAFIAPALSKREKILLFKTIPLSAGLFIFGFSYGFFILYYALGLFASINISLGIANFWNIGQFLSQVLVTAALLGLVFQFPIILTLLIKLKIITTQVLKDNRRIAYFFALCMTALLPPTDGISLLAMTLPLVLLYEGTVLFNK